MILCTGHHKPICGKCYFCCDCHMQTYADPHQMHFKRLISSRLFISSVTQMAWIKKKSNDINNNTTTSNYKITMLM